MTSDSAFGFEAPEDSLGLLALANDHHLAAVNQEGARTSRPFPWTVCHHGGSFMV